MDVDATPGAGLSPGNAPSQGINGRRLFSSQGAPTPASARRRPHVRGDLQNSVPRPRVRNANMAAGPAISGDIAPVRTHTDTHTHKLHTEALRDTHRHTCTQTSAQACKPSL